jgi:predicted ATPase/DNA-binding XRE family transcriptional regulator
MIDPISFGTWLRQKRRSLDLTQKVFAEQIGCAEITLRRMEADAYKPSNALALVLFEKLGIPKAERTQWVRFARGMAEYPKHHPISSPPRKPKTNFPIPLTSFIGREKDIERIQHRLAGHRLVTLIGVGGIGKTRLSQQAANQLLDNYADGVWLVEFASLNDPLLVPQSVATAFGIQQGADHSGLVETLVIFFSAKTILLILDNCEHLLDACAKLADQLLRSCPNLKILATSRQALGIIGEALYQVPSLTIPDIQQISLIEKLNDYESIRLFYERAQLVQLDFALTKNNASSIAQICSRLDGIPLAIELAAVQIQTISAEQIAEQLDRCFHILTGGSRTALPKHQTLQASIDWSWHLLHDGEQILLRRLSVFAGGWTLDAAERVCVGEGVEADAILNLMTQLVNKSLVISERAQGKETRYRILETIRQYASERLLEASESEQLRNRHLDFFLWWTERVEPKVRGRQQLKWLDQLEAENDNLRVALEWSLTKAEHGEASLRLAGALPVFWYQRGYINEGLAWLVEVLGIPTAESVGGVRAKALYGAGFLACWQGNRMGAARIWLEESADLWRKLGLGGRTGLAHALATLSEAMRLLGEPAAARSLAGEAAALSREQDDYWGLAYALTNLGTAISDQATTDEEDFALAHSTIDESIALWRELGDSWGLVLATHRLGEVAMRQGDYEVARRHFLDCLVVVRKLGDQEQEAWKLSNLASIALSLGDWAEAKAYTEESFNLFREVGSKYGESVSYCNFGFLALMDDNNHQAQRFFEQAVELACTSGPIWVGAMALVGLAGATASSQAPRAARLLGAAEARLEAGASYWGGVETLCVGRLTATAMAQLGGTVFAKAQAEGRAMTFEQAVAYALVNEPSA